MSAFDLSHRKDRPIAFLFLSSIYFIYRNLIYPRSNIRSKTWSTQYLYLYFIQSCSRSWPSVSPTHTLAISVISITEIKHFLRSHRRPEHNLQTSKYLRLTIRALHNCLSLLLLPIIIIWLTACSYCVHQIRSSRGSGRKKLLCIFCT